MAMFLILEIVTSVKTIHLIYITQSYNKVIIALFALGRREEGSNCKYSLLVRFYSTPSLWVRGGFFFHMYVKKVRFSNFCPVLEIEEIWSF